ncbi:MAG: hypothetical protein ACXWV0_07805 [Flavisolibacter sp.]
MRYLLIGLLFLVACNTNESQLSGTWKLSRIYDHGSKKDNKQNELVQQGIIKRSLSFSGKTCTDVFYRNGQLVDSARNTFVLRKGGTQLALYEDEFLVEFWEFVSFRPDTMELLNPTNLVYVYIKQ